MENNDAPQQEPTTAKAKKGRRVGIIVGAIALTAVVTAGATAVLANVIERMSEAKDPYTKVVELDDTISDPAVWGQNFPLQYEAYLRSSEMTPTVFGGSHEEERTRRRPTRARSSPPADWRRTPG